jgi:hypothetical protein
MSHTVAAAGQIVYLKTSSLIPVGLSTDGNPCQPHNFTVFVTSSYFSILCALSSWVLQVQNEYHSRCWQYHKEVLCFHAKERSYSRFAEEKEMFNIKIPPNYFLTFFEKSALTCDCPATVLFLSLD